MKQKLFFIAVVAGFIFFTFFTSCTKCDDATSSQTFSTATIHGTAYANLDLSNDTNQFGNFEIQWEKVPAGTKIFARINSEDLDPNPSGFNEYQDITFETAVGNNGDFEVEVYAGKSNVQVTLLADDFKYNQKINDSTYQMKIFSLQNQFLSVINNQVKLVEIRFDAN